MWLLMLSAALAEPVSLTYEEALRRASEANPTVLGATQDVLAAEGALLAARAPFGATLTATGGYGAGEEQDLGLLGEASSRYSGWNAEAKLTQPFASGTSVGLTLRDAYSYYYSLSSSDFGEFEAEGRQFKPALSLEVSQALLQGFKLSYNLQGLRAAATAKSVAEAQRQGRRQTALATAAKAYWNLYYTHASVEIARGTEALQQEQERIVRALVEAGRLAPVEVTRSQAAVAQAERARLDAESAYLAASDALQVAMGATPRGEVVPVTAPAPPPELRLDEVAVVDAVLQGNADLLTAKLQVDGARRAATDARHALLPELGVTGAYTLSGSDADMGTSWQELGQGALYAWNVGGQLTVPLANRADRGAARQREAEAEKARLDFDALAATLAQEARAQARQLQTARRAVELAELNVKLAEETLAVEQARVGEGKALQKDVIQAVNDLASARVAREKALIDFHGAVIELERLKGAL